MNSITVNAVVINDDMGGCIVDCEFGCLYLPPNFFPLDQKLEVILVQVDE